MSLSGGAGAALSAALGLVFGSFANVCIHRIPAGESIVAPRSRCPRCRAPIRWQDNLPLLSWVLLRGRCRGCGMPISWGYPLVEALMAAGFVGAWALQGLSLDGAAAAWLFFSCVALGAIDSRHFVLPDLLTLTGLGAGIAFALARGIARLPSAGEAPGAGLLLGSALDVPPLPMGAIAGAAAGAAIPLAARGGYRLVRRLREVGKGTVSKNGTDRPGDRGVVEGRVDLAPAIPGAGSSIGRAGGRTREGGPAVSSEPTDLPEGGAEGAREEAGDDVAAAALEEGMGLGDVKMLAMVGAFLGPRGVLVTILAASIGGCIVVLPWMLATRRSFRTPIPFGPFLSFGAILALFAGGPLAEGYERLLLRILG